VRVELFGDEIESVRAFDPASQRSYEEVEGLTVLPAREVLLGEGAAEAAAPRIEEAGREQAERLRSTGKDMEADRLEGRTAELVEALREGGYVRGVEYLLPFFYPERATALDYVPEDAIVVVDEPLRLAEE